MKYNLYFVLIKNCNSFFVIIMLLFCTNRHEGHILPTKLWKLLNNDYITRF